MPQVVESKLPWEVTVVTKGGGGRLCTLRSEWLHLCLLEKGRCLLLLRLAMGLKTPGLHEGSGNGGRGRVAFENPCSCFLASFC